MKILIFHPSLAPYRVDFFNTLNENFDAKFYFFHDNVLDQKFNQNKLKQELNFQCNYLNKGLSFFGRPIRFGITKIIKTNKPDTIICPEYGLITLFITLASFFFRKKYKVFTICDDSIAMSANTKPLRKICRSFLVKALDGIILTNQDIVNWYTLNLNIKCKLLTFPIIINEHAFRNKLKNSLKTAKTIINNFKLSDKKVILFVGRLVKVKNLPTLIKSFSKVRKDNIMLVLVGSGDEQETLKLLVSELQLNQNVIFAGRQEGTTLLAWYAITNVFILPSISEAFGAVVNEALLSGSYVLCSELAGAKCLIQNGINGRVFNPYNHNAFKKALEEGLEKAPIITGNISLKPSLMQLSYHDAVALLINQLKH